MVTINGKRIDNSKEEYPLLTYNNITYLPLTWKFAHDQFGWDYVWDDSKGLSIHSSNPQISTMNLDVSVGGNDIALFRGYLYFLETEKNHNYVYRIPLNDSSHKELVYSYDLDSSYILNKNISFEVRDNELWFYYHVGGALMGSDVYCKVQEDGKATVEHRGYLDFKNTNAGTLTISHAVPPNGNNLLWIPKGYEVKDGKSVGDSHLIYGWHITNGGGYAGDNSTTIIDNYIYVLASTYPVENNNLNRIYKINILNNETTKIIDSEVSHFKIINNKLYFVKDADNCLYVSNIDGTKEQKLSDHEAANWYDEIDGTIYYTSPTSDGYYQLYKSDPAKEDLLLLPESIDSVKLVNGKLICQLAKAEDYGVKVFDKSGNLLLAITDQVSQAIADNDSLLIVSSSDQTLKLVKY
jgi:hypothetical protein